MQKKQMQISLHNNRQTLIKYGLMIASLVLFMALGLIFMRSDGYGLKADIISEKKLNKLLSGLSEIPQDQELPASLYIDDIKLPCDRGSRTFYLPVSLESSLWESGTLGTKDKDAGAFFVYDFRKEDKLSLCAANEGIPFYIVSPSGFSLCSLHLTGLPVLSMDQTGELTDEGLPLFSFGLFEAGDGRVSVTEGLTTGTLRGNTSLTYEKKSLRLKLKQKKDGMIQKKNESLLGLRSDDDWILNSLYADNTRLRDKLCMDLWNETGALSNPFGVVMGVSGEYTEVVIDNGYAGLYLLTYPVDRKLLKMDRVSKKLESGLEPVERIYKKKYSSPLDPDAFKGPLPDPAMPFYRGGYVLKGDTILQNEGEWDMLFKLSELMAAPDDVFSEGITGLCDETNVLENWLFYQAVGGYDNENKNHYFVTRDQGGSLKGYFIPWDMNISFGCVYTENVFYSKESMEPVEDEVLFEPGSRMARLNAGGSRAVLKSTWEKWRRGVFSDDRIMKRIDEMQDTLIRSGAMDREMERWPAGNASKDTAFMKDFTKKRLAWLDSLL